MAPYESREHYWTAFPSLLPLLETDDDRQNLDRAVAAFQCGRYAEARELFEHRLPAPASMAWLAMEFADGLELQGDERRRVQVLETALQGEGASNDERLVLELMLLEARLWTDGQMDGLAEKAREVQKRVAKCELEKLTDLELKAIWCFYRATECCMRDSNYTVLRNGTVFEHFQADKALEIKELCKSLVNQGRYIQAVDFMRRGLHLHDMDLISHAMDLCHVLENMEAPPLLYSALRLKDKISERLWDTKPHLAIQIHKEAKERARDLGDRLQFPLMELNLAMQEVQQLEEDLEKQQRYLKLVEQASIHGDYLRTNQAYIAAREAAENHARAQKTLPGGLPALRSLHGLLQEYLQFHREKSGLHYYEAYAVWLLMTLQVEMRENHHALSLAEEFLQAHPNFSIPNTMQLILERATAAAEALGLERKASQLYDEDRKWLTKCAFRRPAETLDPLTMTHAEYYIHHLSRHMDDPEEYGMKAIQLALAWAKLEWETRLLSTRDWRAIFQYPPQEDQDRSAFQAYIEKLENRPNDVYTHFFGPKEAPTPSPVFLQYMRTLKEWLCVPERPPSYAARTFVARCIMNSRLDQTQDRFSQGGNKEESEILSLMDEEELYVELVALDEAVRGVSTDLNWPVATAKIHATLTKAHLPRAVERNLVSEEALAASAADCAELADKYANGGRVVQEYGVLVTQARTMLVRFLLFGTGEVDACIVVLERAERLVDDLRKQIVATGLAAGLSAKIQVAKSLLANMHLGIAIQATFFALVRSWEAANKGKERTLQEVASKKYFQFLRWTLKSKGRGFADIIFQDPRYAPNDIVQITRTQSFKPITEFEGEHRDDQTLSKESSAVNANQLPEVVSKAMIDEMLQEVGDGIVIVDFIDMNLVGSRGCIAAVLYRRDNDSLPVVLKEVSMKDIQKWTEKVFGAENEKSRPLTETFDADLKELDCLLTPLLKPDLVQRIQPHETIIFCLSGPLHRVPMHAVPVNGVPLIESHAVAYCQSISALYHNYRCCREYKAGREQRSISIAPTYDRAWTDQVQKEESLVHSIKHIQDCVGGVSMRGSALSVRGVQDAIEDTAHIFYFGHAHFDLDSPMRSGLLLNESARVDPYLRKSGSVGLTMDEIANVRLAKPSLATIIGCGSGATQFSGADDILGLPTAFFLASATSMISTLWRIQADDGVCFALELYRAIHELSVERQKSQDVPLGLFSSIRNWIPLPAWVWQWLGLSTGGNDHRRNSAQFRDWIDLAAAVRRALIRLRERGDPKKQAYHWASFYLTGFWLYPDELGISESISTPASERLL